MNSIQNYGMVSQSTNFKGGVRQKAKRLMDYPLVKNIIAENPAEQPSKILELMTKKAKELVSRNKDFQAGKITQEEAYNRALNLIV